MQEKNPLDESKIRTFTKIRVLRDSYFTKNSTRRPNFGCYLAVFTGFQSNNPLGSFLKHCKTRFVFIKNYNLAKKSTAEIFFKDFSWIDHCILLVQSLDTILFLLGPETQPPNNLQKFIIYFQQLVHRYAVSRWHPSQHFHSLCHTCSAHWKATSHRQKCHQFHSSHMKMDCKGELKPGLKFFISRFVLYKKSFLIQ